MSTKIIHKRNSIPNTPPAAGALVPGEIAMNTADGKLFIKKDDNTVIDTSKQIFERDTNVTVSDNGLGVAEVAVNINNQSKLVIDVDGVEITAPLTISNGETITLNDSTNNKYVAVQAPDNLDYSYVIKLPPNKPVNFSILANDGADGTVWTNPDTFGGNRVYASDKYGDDANDGINRPVRTLKRACQIAASLGQRPKITPAVGYYNAKRLLENNRAFIQEETIGYIAATYPSFTYNEAKCKRDIGLIIDAIIYDMILGGNRRVIEAAQSYLSVSQVINNQLTETADAISYAGSLAALIVKNQEVTVQYQNLLTQVTYPNLPGNVAETYINTAVELVTDIITSSIAVPTIIEPAFDTIPITVLVAAGDFYIDNPIIIPDKVSIVGDSLRSVVIRPLNANKDMFRVRNGAYLTGITFRDGLNASDIPAYTFNWSVAFDDPFDASVDRTGYFGLENTKPRITLSPYIQNCSIISFLGGNGIWVDGSKVISPNNPINTIEVENPVNLVDGVPEQGKSMVANAFTMVSFGGTGWFCTNDAYAQIVSCFQIFCLNGSYCQSGGYLSITNSATNFGVYALRSSGYSPNSFTFDRGYVAATGTNGGAITLTTIGTKRVPVNQYVLRIRDAVSNADVTTNFKDASVVQQFNAATAVNVATNIFTIIAHGFTNGSSAIYTSPNNTPILGLLENGVYYINVIDADTFKLYNDNSLSYSTNILEAGTGQHTLTANVEEFFITETVSSHSAYQSVSLTAGSYTFQPGDLITGTTNGFINNAFIYSYDNATDIIIVSNEFTLVQGNLQRILFDSSSVITSVSGSPTSINVDSAVDITNTYFTAVSQVSSTKVGNVIQSPTNAIGQKIYLHRPSIVNSSAHTWEFAGAGTDYNALPQNGGVPVAAFEQYSELPGRVYSSGTNELGDFKVGDFILAENKTGNITFRTRVTVGEIAVLKLSLSNVEVSEFSTDAGLGDNEPNGAQDSRVSTQKAVRSFIANRLGNVIDKDVSSNAVPGAVVQLNSQGQINQDLLPPARGVTTYNVTGWGNRLFLSEQVPSIQVISGDNASESYAQRSFDLSTAITVAKGDIITQTGTTGYGIAKDNYTAETTIYVVNITGSWNTVGEIKVNNVAQTGVVPTTVYDLQNIVDNFYLKKDTSSQFLILNPVNVPYTFVTTTSIIGANSGAQANITSGPIYGVAYDLSSASLVGGSGYLPSSGTQIYYNVALTNVSGTGVSARADITVTNGSVVSVALVFGGTGYEVGNTLSANTANLGGQSTTAFEIDVLRADARLYVDLSGTYIKFAATPTSPEYIEDDLADVVSIADLSSIYSQELFDSRDLSQGGDVNYAQSKITITGHPYTDGDAVVYNNGANITIGNFINNKVYWVKPIDANTIELYNNYGFTSGSKVLFGASTTGTHSFTLKAVGVESNTFHIPNHGFSTGQVVRFSATNPPGGLINNGYYYIGSISQPDGFTFHTNISDAQASVLGVTVGAVPLSSTGSGSATLTIQNVSIIGTVNSSSSIDANWGQIAQATFDATNIVSGVMSPSRLAATGSATDKTFLRGDSNWSFAVQNIRPAASSPISITGDFYTNSLTNYYYNSPTIDINKASDLLGNISYTNFGVVALNKAQFTVTNGETTIKTGVIDAATLGGEAGNYYTNPANLVGNVPINKGGTNLTTYSKGDLLYSGSNDSLTQLNIGTANSVLTSDGLIPSWSTSLTLGGTLTVSGVTSVNDNTASTSTTTGALKVAGGAGVAGAIHAGSIQDTPIGSTTANTGAFTTLSATGNTTISGANSTVIISPTGTSSATISPTGVLTLGTATYATDLLGNINAVSSNQIVTITPSGTGTVTISPATVGAINKMNIGATTPGTAAFTSLTSSGATTLTASTASTSTTTGTLVVTGGVGVSGQVYAAGIQNTPIGSTTASTGAFTTLSATGATTLTANIASTSTTTGTLVVTGGMGVSGDITVGGVVAGTLQITNGLTFTEGTNVDQLKTFDKSLTVTTTWQDTGIKNTDLATGSYYVQIVANDNIVGGGHVNVYYSGIMSWYAGTTSETSFDEIVLNRAGSSVSTGALFVRLQRSSASADNLRLQILGTTINTGASTYTFKFRRLI